MFSIDIGKTLTDEIKNLQKDEWEIADIAHFGRVIDWKKETRVIIARVDNELVGVLELSMQSGVMHIESLIVKHTMQGQGIGRALVERAEQLAKEYHLHKIYLETGESWNATRFYEALGYINSGILQNHYENIHYIIYSKYLT